MDFEVKGIHYEVSDKTMEQIQKKMKRLEYAQDFLVSLALSIEREKSDYHLNANMSFRWGTAAHIHLTNHDLYKGIDQIIDKLDNKITKEKEKIQDHGSRMATGGV